MSARILVGQPIVDKLCAEITPQVEEFRKESGVAPTLAVVRVGSPPAAVRYAHSIDRAFTECGMGFQMDALPEDASTAQVIEHLNELDRTETVHGILLQSPLPKEIEWAAVMAAFPTIKDVEGISPINFGKLALDLGDYYLTSTPSAVMELLQHYEIPIDGQCAVIVGRSNILGKPLALLMMRANATVIVCHTHTRNLAHLVRQADLVIAAAGKPNLITADMVAPGAVVIDCGVNVRGDRLIGDVDFATVKEVAAAISPVPGGTGPVTTMILMRHTLQAARRQFKQMGTRGRIKWLPTLKSPRQRK